MRMAAVFQLSVRLYIYDDRSTTASVHYFDDDTNGGGAMVAATATATAIMRSRIQDH